MPDINVKYTIISAAIDLYLNDRTHFTVKHICRKAGVSEADFFAVFNSKLQALAEYYPLTVSRYQAMVAEINDYPSFTLEEKLSNFIYTMFDILQEERDFVDETFSPYVLENPGKSHFQKAVEAVFRVFLETDEQLPEVQRRLLLNQLFYTIMARVYISLIGYWLKDTSEKSAETLVLTDKTVALLAEAARTPVLDRGIDLLKHLLTRELPRLQIPFLKNLW